MESYKSSFTIVKLAALPSNSAEPRGDLLITSSSCGHVDILELKESKSEIQIITAFSDTIFTSALHDARSSSGYIVLASVNKILIFDHAALTLVSELEFGPWPLTCMEIAVTKPLHEGFFIVLLPLHGEAQILSIPALQPVPVPAFYQNIGGKMVISFVTDPCGVIMSTASISSTEKTTRKEPQNISSVHRLQVNWEIISTLPTGWILDIPTVADQMQSICKQHGFYHPLSIAITLDINLLDYNMLLVYAKNALIDIPESAFMIRVCEELSRFGTISRSSQTEFLDDGTVKYHHSSDDQERAVADIDSSTALPSFSLKEEPNKKKRRRHVGFHEAFINVDVHISPRDALRLAVVTDALLNAALLLQLTTFDAKKFPHIDIYSSMDMDRLLIFRTHSLMTQLREWRLLHCCILGIYSTAAVINPTHIDNFLKRLRLQIQVARVAIFLQR